MLFIKKTKNPINRKKNRVKVIKYNAVDKDVQTMFQSLNFLQNMLLCSKYSIRNNFIYKNMMSDRLVGLCGPIVIFVINVNRTYWLNIDRKTQLMYAHLDSLYITSYFDILFYTFGFLMYYILMVVQTNRNIQFVLDYQKVHRFVKSRMQFKKYIFWNWLSVFTMIFSSSS